MTNKAVMMSHTAVWALACGTLAAAIGFFLTPKAHIVIGFGIVSAIVGGAAGTTIALAQAQPSYPSLGPLLMLAAFGAIFSFLMAASPLDHEMTLQWAESKEPACLSRYQADARMCLSLCVGAECPSKCRFDAATMQCARDPDFGPRYWYRLN